MNVAPMILRFCSGSVTPASRSRNRLGGVDEHQRQLQPLEAACGSAAASSSRSTPLSTKMHVSWSPIARWMISAATVESTPPLRPQTTRPLAHLLADPRRRLVDERRHRPVAGAAADAVREVAQDLEAALGVHDLGVKQQRVEAPRSDRPSPRPARWRSWRRPQNPAAPRRRSRRGWPRRESPRARPANSAAAGARSPRPRTVAWPNSRCAAGATRPPSVSRHQLHAVADAEHRDAQVEDRRVARRRAGVRDALRAARQDDPGGLPAPDRLGRRVGRPDLRVDRQLAQTARDELGVLRSEIENDDRLMVHEGPVSRAMPRARSDPLKEWKKETLL